MLIKLYYRSNVDIRSRLNVSTNASSIEDTAVWRTHMKCTSPLYLRTLIRQRTTTHTSYSFPCSADQCNPFAWSTSTHPFKSIAQNVLYIRPQEEVRERSISVCKNHRIASSQPTNATDIVLFWYALGCGIGEKPCELNFTTHVCLSFNHRDRVFVQVYVLFSI